ncbi:MAG: hypothetical protein GC204_14440 [Chloroflexi bacterium]|nr:hypothetical protein [Chloroflexota bacterium]
MTQDANAERREIEKRLMRSADELLKLRFNPEQWLESQALKTFMETLYELVQFHQWHGEIRDTVVGFLGISAYIIVTGLLDEMLLEEKNSDLHEKMKEELDYIKTTMQEIIAEGYAKTYWDEEHQDNE